MAKEQKAIVRFDGGVQSALDQRDIPEEAAANAQNVSINTPGALKVSGKAVSFSPPSLSSTPSVDFQFGHGLYQFNSDHLIDVGELRLHASGSIIDSTVSGYNGTFSDEGVYDFVQLKFATNHGLTKGDLITVSGTGGTYDGDYNTRPTATYYNGTHLVKHIVDADEVIIDATAAASGLPYAVEATVTRYGQSQFVNHIIQNTEKFHILSQDRSNVFSPNLNTDYIDLGSDTTEVTPAFHQARGGVRICDGNFANTSNISKVLHYMPETKLGWGADVNTTITKGWKVSNLEVKKADNNIDNVNNASDQALASNVNGARILYHTTAQTAHTELGTECDGVVWRVFTNTAEGEFQSLIDGDEHRAIQFGHSWIYDGYQEGPVSTLVGYDGSNNDRTWFQLVPGQSSSSLEIDCCINLNDIIADNPRITGCKLYITGTGSKGGQAVSVNYDDDTGDHLGGLSSYDDPLYLAEVDFAKGIKAHDGDYEEYANSHFGSGWADTTINGDDATEQITATNDRTFGGASNWTNGAGANAFNAYDETTSGQLTVTPDDVSDVQYAYLDGANWDDTPVMVEGRRYTLSYAMHISAYTKGTLSVGLSTDAVPAVMKTANTYTATNGSGATETLEFVYSPVDHKMITIHAAANTVLTVDFDTFTLKESGGWARTKEIIVSDYPNISFRMLAGYQHDVASVHAKFKTSCVVDNRVYIGNIEQDVQGIGTTEIFEDRLLVSAIGVNGPMPDVFPADRILEITSNDGDQIVKLEAFKEKIIQLNRDKAIIINVYGPNDMETVESTWPNAGISNPGASTVFEGGCLWANEFGCWMYNGETVSNLIIGKIDNIVWKNFINRGVANSCLIGYCDIDKTITIFNGEAGADNDTYTYNVLTEGWIKGRHLITSGYGGAVSNFVNNFGKIKYIDNPTDTETGETFSLATIISVWKEGVRATGQIGPFNNSWTDTDADALGLYLNRGSGSDGWVQIGEFNMTWDNTILYPGPFDSSMNYLIAGRIAESLNNYNGGNPQFTATREEHPDVPGVENIFSVSLIAKEIGVASNATFGPGSTAAGEVSGTGNHLNVGALKLDNAAQDDAIAAEGYANGGLSVGFGTGWTEGIGGAQGAYDTVLNSPINITPPFGGVDAVADSFVLEVDRLGESTSGDVYSLSFSVKDFNDNTVQDVAVSVTTTGGINTEEKIIDEFVTQLESSSTRAKRRRSSTYFTAIRCSAADGTAATGGSYDFLKITSKQLDVASGSINSGNYYKIDSIQTNVTDKLLSFKEFVPTEQNISISGFDYLTKDQDFGAPGVKKKVYKIYITYKCTGDSTVSVSYKQDQKFVDGAGFINSTYYSGVEEDSIIKSLQNTDGELQVAELKPINSINNIHSFQLQFSGTLVPSDFEINDITIIYRSKRVK